MLWWIKILLNTLYILCTKWWNRWPPAGLDLDRHREGERPRSDAHAFAPHQGSLPRMRSRKKNLRCHCSIDLILIVL